MTPKKNLSEKLFKVEQTGFQCDNEFEMTLFRNDFKVIEFAECPVRTAHYEK